MNHDLLSLVGLEFRIVCGSCLAIQDWNNFKSGMQFVDAARRNWKLHPEVVCPYDSVSEPGRQIVFSVS
jgi:hypothetical protein